MIPNIPGWFTNNLGIKLLALLLALAVYAHVYTEQEQEWQIRVPLSVTGLPRNLVLVEPAPAGVGITARGKGKQLLKFKMQHPRMVVDLGEVSPGRVQRMLSPTDVDLPVGVEATVTGILEPRMLVLAVDTLVTREVEVQVNFAGDLPDGYALAGAVRPVPERVRLTGPSGALAETRFVGTEPLRLDDLRGSGGFELALLTDTLTVSAVPRSVTVEVPVVPLLERALTTIPVRLEYLSPGLRAGVEPDSAAALVRGPAPAVDSLQAGEVVISLDLSGLGPGRHLLPPVVTFANPRIRLVSVRPSRFLVEVGRREP